MPDYCANCGKQLRELATGGREMCPVFHGGNTGFYLTTAGPPEAPHAACEVVSKKLGVTLYCYGAKKQSAAGSWNWHGHPAYIRVRKLLGLTRVSD